MWKGERQPREQATLVVAGERMHRLNHMPHPSPKSVHLQDCSLPNTQAMGTKTEHPIIYFVWRSCSPVGRLVGHTGTPLPMASGGLIMGTEVTQGLHSLSRRHASLSTALRGHSERLRCCHGIRFCIVCMHGIHFITKE